MYQQMSATRILTSKRHPRRFASDRTEFVGGHTVILPSVTCLVQTSTVKRQFTITDSVGIIGGKNLHIHRGPLPLPLIFGLRVAGSDALNAGEV